MTKPGSTFLDMLKPENSGVMTTAPGKAAAAAPEAKAAKPLTFGGALLAIVLGNLITAAIVAIIYSAIH
jgi:hypothetical protein